MYPKKADIPVASRKARLQEAEEPPDQQTSSPKVRLNESDEPPGLASPKVRSQDSEKQMSESEKRMSETEKSMSETPLEFPENNPTSAEVRTEGNHPARPSSPRHECGGDVGRPTIDADASLPQPNATQGELESSIAPIYACGMVDCNGAFCRALPASFVPPGFLPSINTQAVTEPAINEKNEGKTNAAAMSNKRPLSKKKQKQRQRRQRTSTKAHKEPPMLTHLKGHHQCHRHLLRMYNSGHYKNTPKPIDLSSICIICWIARATRLPRGYPILVIDLPPGARLHFDFWFANVTSFIGNNTCLSVVDAKSRYGFEFPSASKRPPLRIVRNLVKLLRSCGYPVHVIRVDEDSGLAKSSDFCRLLADLQVILETTGGYNSTNNGKVERPHRTKANHIRSDLIGAGLTDRLWDRSATYNQCVVNQSWNEMTNNIPLIEWLAAIGIMDHKIDWDAMPPFGSRLYDFSTPKKKLDPRTGIDPRKAPKEAEPIDDDGNQAPPMTSYRFVGYGNSDRILIAFDPRTNAIHPCSHASVDEAGVTVSAVETLSINEYLVQRYPTGRAGAPDENLPPIRQVSSLLTFTATHPVGDDWTEYEILLPPRGSPLGIQIFDDIRTNCPFIKVIGPASALFDQIDESHRRNVEIIAIGKDEPILASTAKELLDDLRRPIASTRVKLTLAKKDSKQRTDLQELRLYHDQLGAIAQASCRPRSEIPISPAAEDPVIASAVVKPASLTCSATPSPTMTRVTDGLISGRSPHYFPSMPPCPSRWAGTRDTAYTPHWNQSAMQEYDRNNTMGVYHWPVLRSSLPPDTIVVQSLLAPTIKLVKEHPDTNGVTVTFSSKHCIQGNRRSPESTPSNTGNPVLTADGFRQIVANASASDHITKVWDYTNAFQHTTMALEDRKIHIVPGPFQIRWFRDRFPHIPIPPNDGSGYAIQLATYFQGMQEAGRLWWAIQRMVLINKVGMEQCVVEPGIFRLKWNGQRLNLGVSTDDCIVTATNSAIMDHVATIMKRYFTLKRFTGSELTFLNIRIIQSPAGISIDQTKSITQLLDSFFRDDEWVKPTADYWDTDLEHDLNNGPVLAGDALDDLCREYRGSPRHWIGALQYIKDWTRHDWINACNRLSSFTAAPTHALFKAIKKLRVL